MVSSLTITGTLISRVKVSVALTSAEVIDLAPLCWLTLNNRRQSVWPKPDSRPRIEGACYKYLTTWQAVHAYSPFLILQSRTHSHTSSTWLPSWVSAMGLL